MTSLRHLDRPRGGVGLRGEGQVAGGRRLHNAKQGPNDLFNVPSLRKATQRARLDVEYRFMGELPVAEQVRLVMGV